MDVRKVRGTDEGISPAVKRPSSVRTLPIRVPPSPGESLPSYADRLAASLDVPLATLLERIGLATRDPGWHVPAGYGVMLDPGRVRGFACAARLGEGEVSGMLLSRFSGVCCDLSELDVRDLRSLQSATYPQWVYPVGSHVCPRCVVESGGVWKLNWKLAWSFACVRHRCLLVDTCPACRKRIAAGTGQSLPVSPSRVPDPLICRNPRPERGPKNRWTAPCGHPVGAMRADTLEAWPELTRTQAHLDEALDGCALSVAGEVVPSLGYFSDLKALCVLLLTWSDFEDVGEVPLAARGAFGRYADKRDAMRDTEAAPTRGARRSDERALRHHVVPQSAALLAAVVPVAVGMLNAPRSSDLSDVLEPFADRMRSSDGQYPGLARGFSGRLKEAFDRVWRPRRRKPTHRLQMNGGEKKRVDPKLAGLTAGLVPQVLWDEEFTELFAELLPGHRPLYARRFCSAALVKLCGEYTWEGAAWELDLPAGSVIGLAKRTLPALRRGGREELFGDRLHGLARGLAKDPVAVDYGLRRRLLADFTHIDRRYWEAYCAGAVRGRDEGDRRRRWAATWLWCRITEGDYHLSPWLAEHGDNAAFASYRMFTTRSLNSLKPSLVRHARARWGHVLGDDPLRGSIGPLIS